MPMVKIKGKEVIIKNLHGFKIGVRDHGIKITKESNPFKAADWDGDELMAADWDAGWDYAQMFEEENKE